MSMQRKGLSGNFVVDAESSVQWRVNAGKTSALANHFTRSRVL